MFDLLLTTVLLAALVAGFIWLKSANPGLVKFFTDKLQALWDFFKAQK